MSKKTVRMSIYALAAAATLGAVTAATVPAFAWGSGAPDNAYDQAAQGSSSYSGYYNYAPDAVMSGAVKKHHVHRAQ